MVKNLSLIPFSLEIRGTKKGTLIRQETHIQANLPRAAWRLMNKRARIGARDPRHTTCPTHYHIWQSTTPQRIYKYSQKKRSPNQIVESKFYNHRPVSTAACHHQASPSSSITTLHRNRSTALVSTPAFSSSTAATVEHQGPHNIVPLLHANDLRECKLFKYFYPLWVILSLFFLFTEFIFSLSIGC